MKKILAIIIWSFVVAALCGCKLVNDKLNDQDKVEGTFEIYELPQETLQEIKPEDISCAGQDGPLLSNRDIQFYDLDTHEIHLTQAAFERLTPIQLAGKPFVVCANREPIYSGEFMALFMSRSSEKVVILWPSMEGDKPIMRIQLGYPGPDFYTDEDPRSDTRVVNALEQAGLIQEDSEK